MSGKRAIVVFGLAVLIACSDPQGLGEIQGSDVVNGPQGPISSDIDPTIGSGCRTDDPNHICLALKYVVYRDSSGTPLATVQDVGKVLEELNAVWGQCNLSFEVERYLAVYPSDYGLRYNPSNTSELGPIRSKFSDGRTFLVVTTGTWDRTGTLGKTGANAWTTMPGSPPYGAVVEKPVRKNSNLIAHELGHYLNLLHVNDASDLMNPIIYSKSEMLTDSQCKTARSAALGYWTPMIR